MFGLLAAAIFGGVCLVDSAQKSMYDADARARYQAQGKPYYPTSDNKYVYIPTGEKCYITTVRTDTAGSYDTVLMSISKGDRCPSRILYVFPKPTAEERASKFDQYYRDALRKRGLDPDEVLGR